MSLAPAASPAPLVPTVLAPALFVVLWSTGFIFAKAGLPYAEPFTFLLLRYALVVAVMVPVALMVRAAWPRRLADVGHIAVVGLLMHGVYIGGVFASIHHGLPAGVSALIVGLQPILTATVVGPLLGERVSTRQWLGLGLGLGGVMLVLQDRVAIGGASAAGIALSAFALLGITAGTLYQKRFCAYADLRSGAVIQYSAVALAMLVLAFALETMRITWSVEFAVAIAWLSLVLSLGAVSLLYLLIRRGAAAKVASLFYLVPPLTALTAYFLFGEMLGPLALAGMGLAAAGVAIVQRG